MNVLPRLSATAARAAIALSFAALAGHAAAGGSTDIWRNEFPQSFGALAAPSNAASLAAGWNGSTDLWANRFGESFGVSQPGATVQVACGTGSTDIWGNGFRQSFGGAPLSAPAQLVAMCGPLRP
jgi:hypothetical protein